MKRATAAEAAFDDYLAISIHALVKRATQAVQTFVTFHVISIHALVKRATYAVRLYKHHWCISIHALVKRATTCACDCCFFAVYFNPRPREEGDIAVINQAVSDYNFNPRPREEGDVGEREFIMISTKFQSTPS